VGRSVVVAEAVGRLVVEAGRMGQRARSAPVRYAVAFQADGQRAAAGALEVTGEGLVLMGRRRGEPVELHISCDELLSVRIGRHPTERLDGYTTVVLACTSGEVRIAPFGLVLLHEVTDLLAALSQRRPAASGQAEHVNLVVPLRRGSGRRVRELVAAGPPFDPAAHGLLRHDVFLGDQDVVFVFEGPDVRRNLEQTLSEPTLWRAGLAWRGCIAGRPHVGDPDDDPADGRELIYSWRR
jgi:hypothetical protein